VNGTSSVGADGIGTMTATYKSETPTCNGQFTVSLLVLDGGNVVKVLAVGPSFVSLSQEWLRE
jgi:hypothetical protein